MKSHRYPSSKGAKCWLLLVGIIFGSALHAQARSPVLATYIPLADHYAAIIAFERYRQQMTHADFRIQQMRNWDLLRAHFRSGKADITFMMSPLALDTYAKDGNFRWIGLMHRDGNALAINAVIEKAVALPQLRNNRKPEPSLAQFIANYHRQTGRAVEIAVPHILSTHSVVLYQYLQQHGVKMNLTTGSLHPVRAISVAPPLSPAFIRDNGNRRIPAAFEQSLPFADIVETENYGRIAWYSKDVIPHPVGHVECIALASDAALAAKRQAIAEVFHYIQRAAADIEQARQNGGKPLEDIIALIREHVPSHTETAIRASLNPKLRVINYQDLEIDKPGLTTIMDIAVASGILTQPIDIDAFALELSPGNAHE